MTLGTASSTATPIPMHNEKILVIPRTEFVEFSGFTPNDAVHNPGKYLTSHPDEPNLATFMVRHEAEESPFFIQVLPYILLVCGQDIFTYSRNKKGGEARLHDKLSVGIGGHIEDTDHPNPLEAYLAGALREIQEEVGLEIPIGALQNTVVGMLHDPLTPVGRVHLGIMHVLLLPAAEMTTALACAEDTMSEPCLMNIQELIGSDLFESLEPWSQYALTHLHSLMTAPKPWERADVRERLRMLAMAGAEVSRSASELLMQDTGRTWMVGRENVELAVGSISVILSGLTTNRDLDNGSIAEKGREAYEGFKKNSKHQAWQ